MLFYYMYELCLAIGYKLVMQGYLCPYLMRHMNFNVHLSIKKYFGGQIWRNECWTAKCCKEHWRWVEASRSICYSKSLQQSCYNEGLNTLNSWTSNGLHKLLVNGNYDQQWKVESFDLRKMSSNHILCGVTCDVLWPFADPVQIMIVYPDTKEVIWTWWKYTCQHLRIENQYHILLE